MKTVSVRVRVKTPYGTSLGAIARAVKAALEGLGYVVREKPQVTMAGPEVDRLLDLVARGEVRLETSSPEDDALFWGTAGGEADRE